MANFKMNVNDEAMIALTAKLERLNKSAFPSAVRSTLNDCGFEMKKSNILESAKKNMTVRNPTFFKKYTGVKRANGFDVNSMYSEVGFQDRGEVKAKKAVNQGMEANEIGGVDNDGGMYLKASRTSKNVKKGVRRNARFDKGKLAHVKKNAKSNVANLYKSNTQKKPVFIKTSKGSFLVQVKKFERNGGKLDISIDFLMRGRKQHQAHAKATHFIKESALKTQKEIPKFYLKNAEYHFSRIWK